MATASNATTGTNSVSTTEPMPAITRTCNTCSMSFESANSQRLHMKEPWHVYNIKRRMASLPPISAHIFQTQIETITSATVTDDFDSEEGSGDEANNASDDMSADGSEGDDDETIETFPPTCCLFCQVHSSTLEENMQHMSHTHGFHLPNLDYLTDLETFLGYLLTIVMHYHECLYCGHRKNSTQGVRQHMEDKGHCKIDLGPDSGLLDFWDIPETEQTIGLDGEIMHAEGYRRVPEAERRLPSGVIVTPRSSDRLPRRNAQQKHASGRRATVKAITESQEDEQWSEIQHEQQTSNSSSRDRRVAIRGELGLIGVSDQQRRALRAVEKKMLKQETVAKAHQRWAVEKIANKQKHFRPDVPGRLHG